ncbi:MAG TPA: hypothetical protein VG347_05055 [Verrucomicrobiae bacterium]|nr:hypothetical protein [Verrucomicrobiae bacterium]
MNLSSYHRRALAELFAEEQTRLSKNRSWIDREPKGSEKVDWPGHRALIARVSALRKILTQPDSVPRDEMNKGRRQKIAKLVQSKWNRLKGTPRERAHRIIEIGQGMGLWGSTTDATHTIYNHAIQFGWLEQDHWRQPVKEVA